MSDKILKKYVNHLNEDVFSLFGHQYTLVDPEDLKRGITQAYHLGIGVGVVLGYLFKGVVSDLGRSFQLWQKCKHFEGNEKTKCKIKVLTSNLVTAKELLIKARSGCGKARDPKQCSADLTHKIKKIEMQIAQIHKDIRNY